MNENNYVIDPEISSEMARLVQQDRTLNEIMHHLLPEHLDPYEIENVLDLACGSGGWAQNVAKAYPHIQVVGVDISQTMVEHANVRAQSQGIKNCTFEQRTVVPHSALPSIYEMNQNFDFINIRLALAFMRYDQWIPLFQWCFEHLRPGGWLRTMEQGQYAHVHGEELDHWFRMMSKGLVKRGMLNGEFGNVTLIQDKWMEEVGFTNIHETCYLLNFSAGRKHHDAMVRDWVTALQLTIPFLVSQGLGEQKDLEQRREKLIHEMNASEYMAHIYYPSFTGQKP